MYSKLIVLVVAVACIFAAPSTDVVPLEKQQPTVIPIISQSDELEANGTYKFSYETGNGIKREEEAYEKVLPKAEGRSANSNEGGESDEDSNEIHVQRGSYSYTAPDGTLITLSYIADENGFQPIGDHIPRVRVAAQTGAVSSGKSSKALKTTDSTVSASEPKKVEQLAAAPVIAPVSTEKIDTTPKDTAQTTASTNEAPVTNPASAENSADLVPSSTPLQSTSAEATEAPASTVAPEQNPVSNENQTTLNPITEASQSAEAETPSTNAPKLDSVEESGSTTVSAYTSI